MRENSVGRPCHGGDVSAELCPARCTRHPLAQWHYSTSFGRPELDLHQRPRTGYNPPKICNDLGLLHDYGLQLEEIDLEIEE